MDEMIEVSGLTAGRIYRFQYFATNDFGDSPGSIILSAAATDLPNAPTDLTADWAKSTKTSIHLSWTAPTDPDQPVHGYLLQTNSGNGTFYTVYDGSYLPGVVEHTVYGLENGHYYEFRIIALNFNG